MNRILVAAAALCLALSTGARADLPGEGFRNHLVIGLGIGVDAISPSEYNGLTDVLSGGNASVRASTALHVPVSLTYYFPYYLQLRTGAEAAYFFPSGMVGGKSATNYGGIVEVPILLGGHYALLDNRLILELGLGPGIAVYTSAGLNIDNNDQLYGDVSVGFDDELKGQFFVTPGFSIGVELGYRVLTSSALHTSSGASPGATLPVHLDMSGFRAVLQFGFVAF